MKRYNEKHLKKNKKYENTRHPAEIQRARARRCKNDNVRCTRAFSSKTRAEASVLRGPPTTWSSSTSAVAASAAAANAVEKQKPNY